jgi:hypothetical protein
MKPRVRIENWTCDGNHLTGIVYGHPNFADGTVVTTSFIQTALDNGTAIETRNTIYELGKQSTN